MAQLTPTFFNTILKIEGGYQSMPDDSGNYACGQLIGTKYGVSAVAYSTWVNRCPTVQEIQNMTTDTARNFYAWYFDRYNLFQIENQKFFELLANNTMGSPAGAARVEQRALRSLGYPIAVDGNRGPATVAALNDAYRKRPADIYNAVRAEWIAYLKSINKPQFLQGWLYRLDTYFPPMGTAAGLGIGAAALLIAAFLFLKK